VSQGQRIRSYDYVNHPYAQVRDALKARPAAVFQSATKAAASRAKTLASELRIDVGGLKLAADIAIVVKEIVETPASGVTGPSTLIRLEWEAVSLPHLLPFMQAELTLYPLTASETQLDFAGSYQPPLGVLGGAVNALLGHRIAEGSVHRFVTDVAEYLRSTLK
jgi:hypothetical protein